MSKTRFASASLLALGFSAALSACTDNAPAPASALEPFRGDWEEVANWPFDPSAVGTITIGGRLDGDNFANRGNVEVYYVDAPNIIVQMRKFTFAADSRRGGGRLRSAQRLGCSWDPRASRVKSILSAIAGTKTPRRGKPTGKTLAAFTSITTDKCKKRRMGADIRVFLPSTWEGLLNVATEDNVAELEDYPDRGDVTILDLPGQRRSRSRLGQG